MRLCVCMVVWALVGGLLLPLKAFEVPPVQFTTYTTIKLPSARDAFVAYKMENAGEDIREEYSRKIGGMNDYRREMIREATRIWREVKGR